ncbi:murein hydrolase activator EnvC [Pararhizobium sp. IMCC21322]|uniref:murein hydrolase activator EnvC family protein n=1 Tax=Pararhizobium sp. IMCC21322 TaxID=3067903 RepID=UPI002741CF8E|nr:peptidoglycan DD-metalloendopeptidase family protein [Pararhizobium sp. IMCC21322]
MIAFLIRCVVLMSLCLFAGMAAAETPREVKLRLEMEQRAKDLANLQASIEVTAEREAELAADVQALEQTRATLNTELIEAAQRSRTLEDSISNSEVRLDASLETEEVIRLSLLKRRALLGEILATLQRMGRSPPPALLVRPEDVMSAIRSAMLIGAVLPDVRGQAEKLASDLDELVAVRTEIEDTTNQLKSDYKALSEEQTRLALLLDKKREEVSESTSELAIQQQKASELGKEAVSLKELIGSMEEQIAAVQKAQQDSIDAAETARREAAQRAAARTTTSKLQALGDQGRIAPAISFDDAKGLLPLPVSGALLADFGSPDETGDDSKGISIAARPGSAVIAPADGWVVYAGPFRTYGQLLILNAGDDYHLVLAGMETINVELGQFVLSGEPIATMGSRKLANLVTADAGSITNGDDRSLTDSNVTDGPAALYVEFRKDGVSIDPSSWWVVDIATENDLDG